MIIETIKERGLPLPPRIEERFDLDRVGSYYEFLQNNHPRFFSRGDRDRILERHLYESLIIVDYVASCLNVSRETRAADAGSGPGLPGYLFSCLKDAPQLTLIDSSARNLGMLEEFHGKTGGADQSVRFRYDRLEEIKDRYKLITCRALFPFPGVVELVCRMQKRGDRFVIAGADLPINDPRVIKHLARLGYVSRETISPDELKFLGRRNLFVFRKDRETEKGFPRKWKRIKEAQQEWEKQSR